MDGFEEKKWFVYLGDHHEGPFSLAEIQAKMREGQVTTANYIWCDGMPDWKPMTEVTAFESLLNGSTAGGAAIAMEVAEPAPEPEILEPMAVAEVVLPETELPDASVADISVELSEAAIEIPVATEAAAPVTMDDRGPAEVERIRVEKSAAADLAGPGNAVPRVQNRLGRLLVLLVCVVVLAGGAFAFSNGYLDPVVKSPIWRVGYDVTTDFARPYLIVVGNKVPFVGKWISPIPSLNDVTADDYEELKAAAGTKAEDGPRAAVASSTSDPFAPAFYVATNLPDGAQFDVTLEGVPETLLNHVSFSQKLQVGVIKKLGKTNIVRFPDGKPIPRGEYNVYVVESEQQPEAIKTVLVSAQPSGIKLPASLPKGSKVIAKKSYFLGGIKDAVYSARLKEYHDRLRERATTELSELKQFADLVNSQLSMTESTFARLRRGKVTKSQQGSWAAFHAKWTQLDAKLNESFAKWTPQVLQDQYFYGALYELTRQAGQAIAQLHGVHHAYFTGAVDKASYDIQLAQAVSQAQNAVSALKAKVEQAEKQPASDNGMPRREGL